VKPETRLVHRAGSPLAPPLDRSSTTAYESGEPGEFFYQRYAHATGTEAERLLGELDGGKALLYSSGSAATTCVVLALLSPGDTIALARDAYFGTGVLFRALERWGLRVVEFDQTGPPPRDVEVVWLEAPANPLLSFPDLDAQADAAKEMGARVVVDATAATPLLLRPLERGADIVVHSATKFLGGHSDVLSGVTVCRSPDDHDQLLGFRGRSGMVAAPDAAWLLLRGLRTLSLRIGRQSATALELARRLAAHPAVLRVNYPGLGNEVAARYMPAFGGLMSFEVADGSAARAVETSTRVITNATSLGGVESLIESRHRWEPERVSPGLLRLSVGLEDVDDLWADLEQALAAAH
jgi:cystathionine gamma-synthase